MGTSVLILYCGYSLLQLYLFVAQMFLTLITKGHVQLPCVLLTYLHQWSFKARPYFLTLQDASVQFSWVQLLSRVRLFATPWTAACQASLSITNSRSLPKLISIDSVMPSNHLNLCYPLLLLPSIFPSIRVFSNQVAFSNNLFASGGQSIKVSASISVLPMNPQDWSPLGWTSWISLQSKGLSRVVSNTTVQKH